ncbi:MAG TPA: hypothetical protein VE870_00720 [Bacteroidales bacterium]|nr:hypothetical protein [Bacteroidales bacterium]
MKKYLLFGFIAFILASCGSVNKKMQRGDYDGVINKSVKRLIKDPEDSDDIKILDKSYKLANERDLARIKFLKTEDNPNNYDEIFQRYETLKARQAKVRVVLPLNLNGRTINYAYVDYDAELVSAKKKAAEYYYNNGQKLLNNGDKMSYREAYFELVKAQLYSGDAFPNLNDMILEAHHKGMSRVIVEVQSSNRIMVAPEFRDDLLTFNTQDLNSEWVEYHFRHLNDDIQYDYAVVINVLDIIVSPEDSKQSDNIYKKKVEDGFDYALDANGNVMRDTSGNDIKIPRYKTLQCTLIETSQHKAVTIKGQVEITQLTPETKLMVKEPIGAENVFDHVSARAVGDEAALDEAAKQKLTNEAVPFPPDAVMIMNTAETLKPAIREALYKNRRYIL